MNPTVAVVSQGAMGAGVGGRLKERGLTVITSLAGRSEASAKRAKAAGMVAVSDQECAQADFFLSICPPSEAMALAEKMSALIKPNNKKPIYVDCNAVSPSSKIKIGEVVAKSGAPFVDGGIIGLPPKEGYTPFIHVAGPEAEKVAVLNEFGIKINVVDGVIGSASALKMCFGGITKGVTAVASMMMLSATRAGVADKLRAELERSYPTYLTSFQRSVPDMFDKAYRFVGEMEEISDFNAEGDPAAKKLYQAVAEFYTRIAADHDGKHEETGALAAFLKKKD
jgi:L-threonate 2-dehydrogenase